MSSSWSNCLLFLGLILGTLCAAVGTYAAVGTGVAVGTDAVVQTGAYVGIDATVWTCAAVGTGPAVGTGFWLSGCEVMTEIFLSK